MDVPPQPEDVERLRAAIERADPSAELEQRVRRQIAQAGERRSRRRTMSAALLVAAAAAGLVLLARPGATSPTVAQVVDIAAAAARAPAPALDASDRGRLAAHVDGVWFPSWRSSHWRPVASSTQAPGGHRSMTVYYARGDGARIAYTIVAVRELRWPRDTRVVRRGWTRFEVYADAGRRVIGWHRLGRQCLIAAPRSLPETALLALAASDG